MKSKSLSLLLVVCLLLPTSIETFVHFSDHKHEICNEDGIHFHENLPDCHLCLLTKVSSDDFLLSIVHSPIIIILDDNYELNSFYYSKEFYLNLNNRGPPSNIS